MRKLRLKDLLSTFLLYTFATHASANLVVNGDFEGGDQDFLTDYTLGIGVTAQRYNVTTDPRLYHGGATSYGDNTSGSGNMMAVNGPTVANQMVWGQEVSIASNTDYEFSIWVSSWISGAPANLTFDLGGMSLGSVIAPLPTAIWEQYSVIFNSGATSGSVLLSIVDTTLAFGGNDFALDDISLTAVPVPAAVWLFGSGLLGMIGVARRNRAA